MNIENTIAEFTKTAVSRIEAAEKKTHELESTLFQVEQGLALRDHYKSTTRSGADESAVAEALFDDEDFQALAQGRTKNSATVQLRSGVSLLTRATVTSASYPTEVQRLPGMGGDVRRPLRLLDVLPRVEMTHGTVQFVQLGAYANAAGYQIAQGDLKAEASLPTTVKTVEAATLAHWIDVSEQVLADAPILRSQISGLLLHGLADRVEREIIGGAGTAGTITGLATSASPFVATGAPADRIGAAAAALAGQGWNAGTVVLNPADWFAIASERNTQKGYVAGGWNLPASPNLWGAQVVLSGAQAAGTALVFDAEQVAILDRQAARIDVAYQNDGFTRNLLTIRCEMRAALAIYSPGAIKSVALA